MTRNFNVPWRGGAQYLLWSTIGIFLLVFSSWAADGFDRRDVKLKSQGLNLAGWLYVPKGNAEKRPAIVMANGYSLPKEGYMDVFAEPLAAAGFVVLVFDYRFLYRC
jgi:dipeptidyl aminopeptidase/acylaminoacyl peptidase